MAVVLKFEIVCVVIISLSQSGISQRFPPIFDSTDLLQFSEGCSTNILATVTARGNNGVITISAYDDATRAKVDVLQTSRDNSAGFSSTIQIKQKAFKNVYLDLFVEEMNFLFKLEIVCILIVSVSQSGLSQAYRPQFYTFPLVQFDEGCSKRTLATITARSGTGIVTISANDDATRNKVDVILIRSNNSAGFSTTVLIKQKACMDRETEPTWYLHLLAEDTLNSKSAAFYDDAFEIDRKTGSITVEQTLDFSKLSVYQYLVFGTDGGGLKGNATLIILIQDIQNKPPYFTGQPYNADIPEESPVGTTINFPYPIRAIDGDTGVQHAIEYNFTEGECKDLFEIKSNGIFGIVTVKKRIDRDDGVIHKFLGVCTMTLMALENISIGETNPGPSTSTTPVVIYIIDIDDNLPKFPLSMYNATVFENLGGIPLTIEGERIKVMDVDQGGHSLLHLEVQYANGTKVQGINPVPDMIQGSGNIMLYLQDDFSFDFENVQEISYALVASEVREPANTAQCTVNLKIIDRNDNLPQFTSSLFVAYIPENNTNVQQVLSEHATDKDSGLFGEITYSLRGGGDIFYVDNVTGSITKRENISLDYEKRDEYVLTLVAKDGGGRLQLAEVIVRLDDINDNHPVFSQSSYTDFVEENVKPFAITISAFDRDKTNTTNSRVEYYLIDSPFHMQNKFTISTITRSGEFLGSIALIGSLDYEQLNETTGGKVILYVLAKDLGSPSLGSTCTVTINVQDLNDNTPEFDSTEYKIRIFENATLGDYVGNVTATDADGTAANKDLSYYIITGSGLFRINGWSGVMTVNLNVDFDRETTAIHNLTIVAVDRGTPPKTGHTNVTVFIDDVNDTPPKFDKDIFLASVLENTTVRSLVTICSATDQDLNSYLFYKIIDLQTSRYDNDTVMNWFRINHATGEVTINSSLDREFTDTVTLTLTVEDINAATASQTATSQITRNLLIDVDRESQTIIDIEVEANDTVFTSTTQVKITVLDINDNSPVFFPNTNTIYLQENNGTDEDNIYNSSFIIWLNASDADEGPNAEMTYTIINNFHKFQIDSFTGIVTATGHFDRENEATYILKVTVCDNALDPFDRKTSTASITVHITDVNDNVPYFPQTYYNVTVREDRNLKYPIMYVTAADRDISQSFRYSIEPDSDTERLFEINEHSGLISVNASLHNNYGEKHLIVWVEDIGGLKNSTRVTITVEDINGNAPVFLGLTAFYKIYE
ncbi:Hypothetical predicted protein, partial [Mytilus galloprovincialis]